MKQLANFSLLIARLLVTSILALCLQIFLTIRNPDYLLLVQESIKRGSVDLFQQIDIDSGYRVAYNLLNGDGILVHTFFVVLVFIILYLVFALLKKLFR